MDEQPKIRLDPERLKTERHDVDLGEEETGHDHLGRDAGRPPQKGDHLAQPIAGSSPPAR
jgi:hypothetical protein